MQSENLINNLPASSYDGCEGYKAELCDSHGEPCSADPQQKSLEVKANKLDVEVSGAVHTDFVKAGDGVSAVAAKNLEVKENKLDEEISETADADFVKASDGIFPPAKKNLEVKESMLDAEVSGWDDADFVKPDDRVLPAAEVDGYVMESLSVMEVTTEVKEVLSVAEDDNCINSEMQSENGCLKEISPISRQKREGSPVSNSLSGSKKAKIMIDEQQPSVKVMFNFLTRDSKRKLEELLQHWSEWHAKQSSSSLGSIEVLESGEHTYFPALRIGRDDSSAVSVWMDNRKGSQHNEEMTPLVSKSIPLYDRGYSWALTSTDVSSNQEGGLEIELIDSRCFNCGAYDHALKECPKPRDNAAVSNARKEHNSRRNLNASSRNPSRYYQDSSNGKYDGLKPGALDAETRKLLGLGELDPPPWLNRMREIGYPPGYLDPDDEDQPSGILIFGDEEHKAETEDGEILDTDFPEPSSNMVSEPPRKMSVQFPGINAPIPENAFESRWSVGPSSSGLYTNRSQQRANYFSERSTYHDQRWSRDIKNESHSTSGYEDLDCSYNFHREGGIIIASPIERSLSNRGRWSPSTDDSRNGSYSSRQGSPPNRLFSSHSYGSGSSQRWEDDRRNDVYPSRHRERDWDRVKDRDDNYQPYRRR